MKQSLSDIFSVDEFGMDEAIAPRVYEMPPKNHFIETKEDQERTVLYTRILPSLQNTAQRRIAAMLILDQEPITIPEFRDLGISRAQLTKDKQYVQRMMATI